DRCKQEPPPPVAAVTVTGDVDRLGVAERPNQGDHPEADPRPPRHRQPRPHPDADVAAVGPGERQPQQHAADQEADQPAGRGPSTPPPTTALDANATARVSGANRSVKARPNVPACSAISFTSTIGPTTMNARRALSENWVRLAATKASASEQIAITTASAASARNATGPAPATASRTLRGTTVCRVAAVAAPTIREPPACNRSRCAGATSTAPGGPSSPRRRRARSSRWSRPVRAHTRP